MHNHRSLAAVIVFCAALSLGPRLLPAGEIVVESAQVRLIDDVEVPARDEGVLQSVAVHEGASVAAGDPIARLDETEARLARDRARIDLDTAAKQQENDVPVRLARQAALDASLAVDRARLDLLIATREATNDVKVRLGRKTLAVAEAELGRAVRSRAAVEDAVSQSEVDMLQLSVDRSKLETEQAGLDLEIARLTARIHEAEVERLKLGIETAALNEEQARLDLELAGDLRRARANELELAELKLTRRTIVAPVAGVVVKVFRRRGEWVKPGESVMRIVRMDRLRIEGFVNASDARGDLEGRPAHVTFGRPDGQPLEFVGTVVFVSPEIDPVNNQVRVWAEVDNAERKLRPGMRVEMTIDGEKPAGGEQQAGIEEQR